MSAQPLPSLGNLTDTLIASPTAGQVVAWDAASNRWKNVAPAGGAGPPGPQGPKGDPGAQGPPGASGGLPPLYFDVTAYGAVADGVTDCAPAYRTALAAAQAVVAATNVDTRPTIYFPAAALPYNMNTPCAVPGGIDLFGNSLGSQVHGATKSPVFVLAFADPGVAAGDRPDSFGILDSGAAVGLGARRGLSTAAGRYVQVQWHDLSIGQMGMVNGTPGYDHWGGTDQITIDFVLRAAPGHALAADSPVFGMGVATSSPKPRPWCVAFGPDTQTLVLRWCDDRWNDDEYTSSNHTASVSLAGASSPYRVTFQADLRNGAITAWVNRTQVAVAVSSPGGTPFAAGHFFRFSSYEPLLIGNEGFAPGGTVPPFELHGLRVALGNRYVVRSAGQAQQRADAPGTALTDSWQYFTVDASLLGLLPLDDTDVPWAVRLLDHQGVYGSGLWRQTGGGGVRPNTVRGLRVTSHGPSFLIEWALTLYFDDVKAHSDVVAVADLSSGANYQVTHDHCDYGGYDTAVFGYYQVATFTGSILSQGGTDFMRFVSCDVTSDVTLFSFGTDWTRRTISLFPGDYGGSYAFRFDGDDSEGRAVIDAVIACWTHTTATTLKLEGFYNGGASGKPLVKLHGHAVDSSFPIPSVLDMRLCLGSANSAVVETDSADWHGTIDSPSFPPGTVFLNYTGPGGTYPKIKVAARDEFALDADAPTVTFDLALARRRLLTLGGNRTLALANDYVGQEFEVLLTQDGTGSRTVTWWAGIRWPGGVVPTLTATPNKSDRFKFVKVAAGSYLGTVVSQNS